LPKVSPSVVPLSVKVSPSTAPISPVKVSPSTASFLSAKATVGQQPEDVIEWRVGHRSIEELTTILSGVKNPLYRLIFNLILGTGMRAVEIINLKIKNLSLKESRPKFGFTDFKTNERRTAYIPFSLLKDIQVLVEKAVKEGKSDEAFLFPGLQPRGGKGNAGVGERTLRRHLRYVAPENKYPEISLGYLRQCFGWFLCDLGANEEHLYSVMGTRHAKTVQKMYKKTPKYSSLPKNILSPLDILVDWAALEREERKSRLASHRF